MKKNSRLVYLLLVIGAAFWTMGCASSPNTQNQAEEMITVQAIQDHPDQYAGTTVQMTGRFKGWKGACQESPPKTRSDWMLADDTGCIYVTGSVPDGLSPMSPNDETIDLTAVVRLSRFGVPYLEVQSP